MKPYFVSFVDIGRWKNGQIKQKLRLLKFKRNISKFTDRCSIGIFCFSLLSNTLWKKEQVILKKVLPYDILFSTCLHSLDPQKNQLFRPSITGFPHGLFWSWFGRSSLLGIFKKS